VSLIKTEFILTQAVTNIFPKNRHQHTRKNKDDLTLILEIVIPLFLDRVLTDCESHAATYLTGTEGLFRGAKRPKREAGN
jgi:hypothetical protein